jgi:general secretion pathway protein B
MSYVLDALKRASAERERGSVPGLHAQALPSVTARNAEADRLWPWVGFGTIVAVVGAGFVWWPRAEVAVPAPVAVVQPAAPAAAVLPVPVIAPVPAPASAAVAPVPALAPVAAPAAPLASARLPAAPPAQLVQVPPKPLPTPEVLRAGGATSAKSALVAERTPTAGELPADIQAALPKLVVNGSVYSDKPAERLLILNGQPVHEGDSPAPDLVLERIEAGQAIFRFRSSRFTLGLQ